MAFQRSIRSRRGRRKINQVFELQLTSMMDVLVIIVVFLLKSYSTTINTFTTVPGMQLPISRSEDMPPESLQVIITPEAVTFENERILEFVQTAASLDSGEPTYQFKSTDLDEGGRRIIPLYDALSKARDKAELLRAKSKTRDEQGNPLPFEGVLAIQADKRVQYETVRRVMYTSAAAGYKIFRFLALQKE
ncbi:MAG: biopolymer transporter ExbD [Oligoflexia bacterium]|nr:biopolymer transporter ExbD [Oligoflexia bacterium]